MPPAPTSVSAFERTNFFYGLLMDVERFRKDHAFFNGKRWLLNRLALGSGVACGLGVRSLAGPPPVWIVDPGVAIDPSGREIVVGESQRFNPAQPTDDTGHAVGSPLTTGTVEIGVAYVEVPADPVPVLVPDCDGDGECAPSTIRESFVVVVRTAPSPAAAIECATPAFPVPPGKGLHEQIVQRLQQASLTPPADPCVPIARIDLATGTIDAVVGRPVVYSNRLLFELIVCLAEHVAAAAAHTLRYVSGDGQNAAAGSALPNPLVVELVDVAQNAVAGATVRFTVSGGAGTVGSATAVTGTDGRASTTWTLGTPKGAQQVTATAEGTAFAVTFRATGI